MDERRPVTDDERALLAACSRMEGHGTAFPVRKLTRRWVWDYRTVKGPPVVFKTRREAVASVAAFLEVLRVALGAPAGIEPCSPGCSGWIHMDDSMGRGAGIERCDECDRYADDAAAGEAHTRECGCAMAPVERHRDVSCPGWLHADVDADGVCRIIPCDVCVTGDRLDVTAYEIAGAVHDATCKVHRRPDAAEVVDLGPVVSPGDYRVPVAPRRPCRQCGVERVPMADGSPGPCPRCG